MIPRRKKHGGARSSGIPTQVSEVGEIRLRIDGRRLPSGTMARRRWAEDVRRSLEKGGAPADIEDLKRRVQRIARRVGGV